MRMIKILFLFYLATAFYSQSLWAYPEGYLYQRSFLPNASEFVWKTDINYQLDDFDLEYEFEGPESDEIDDIDHEQNSIQQTLLYGLSDETTLWAGLSYVHTAERSRKYDQDANLLEMKSKYQGIEFFEFGLVRHFPNLRSNGIEQAALFELRSGGVFKSTDDRANIAGLDAKASYLFSFDHSWGGIMGSLNAKYFSKKKRTRVDGETEETLAYSAFSLWVGPRFEWKDFYIATLAGFGLMTDFVIESPSYNRSSDSGFLTRGSILTGYDFGKWGLEINYVIGSDIFNKNGPLRVENKIDFELETQEVNLAVLWDF